MSTAPQKAATDLKLHQFINCIFKAAGSARVNSFSSQSRQGVKGLIFYSFQGKIYLPTFQEIQRTKDLS